MAVAATDLRWLNGFLVADHEGRVVGRVECPMYGTAPDVPDALAVRSGFLARRRRVVPADAIEDVDDATGVIGRRVGRDSLKSFLSPTDTVAAKTTARCESAPRDRPSVGFASRSGEAPAILTCSVPSF